MMLHYNLEHTFNKFIGRKVKDKLSAFLPSLPGNIDIPAGADGTGESSLRKVTLIFVFFFASRKMSTDHSIMEWSSI